MNQILNDKFKHSNRWDTIPMQSVNNKESWDLNRMISAKDFRKRESAREKHLVLNYFKPENFGYDKMESFHSSTLFDRMKQIEHYKRARFRHYTMEDLSARIYHTFVSETNRGQYTVPSVVFIVEPVADEHEGKMDEVGIQNMHFIVSTVQIRDEGYFIENVFEIQWNPAFLDQITPVANNFKIKGNCSHNKLIEVSKEIRPFQKTFQNRCQIQPRHNVKTTYIWFDKAMKLELKMLLGGGLVYLNFPLGELVTINVCTGRKFAYRPYARREQNDFIYYHDYILPLDKYEPDKLDFLIRHQPVIRSLKWYQLLPRGRTIVDETIDGRDWMHINVFAWTDYWGAHYVYGENSKGETITHIFI